MQGNDWLDKLSRKNAAGDFEFGNLFGQDEWFRSVQGSYVRNPDGTQSISSNGYSTADGNDIYGDSTARTTTSVTPDANGSTTLAETAVNRDSGNDQYHDLSLQQFNQATDGSQSTTEHLFNYDSGNEADVVRDTVRSKNWNGRESRRIVGLGLA